MKDKLASIREAKKNLVKVTIYLFILGSIIFLNACQGVSAGSGSQQPQVGTLSLGNSALDFGAVAPGASKTLTVTAINSGSAAVTISSASTSSKYFTLIAPTLPASVPAGQSTTLSVQFTPNTAGSFSATATLNTDGSNPTVSLSCSGTGAASAGQLLASPDNLGLGNVIVGTSGTATGSLSAQGGSVTVTAAETNNSVFSLSGLSLPVTISVGQQSVPFTVTFSPQVAGTASGTLTFTYTSNGQTSTTAETLSGTGMPAPTHSVNLSWSASTSSNISGYNIYRALYATSCGSFSKINSVLNTGTLYTDTVVVDGRSYCYAATAVNTSNQESGYSNIVSNVQIPAP